MSDPDDNASVEVVEGRDDLPLSLYWELDEVPMTVWAFRLYAHFVRRAGRNGQVFPSYRSMGEACYRASMPKAASDTLRRKAIEAVKELLELGLITRDHRKNAAGNENTTNIYRLEPRRKWLEGALSFALDEERGPQGGRIGLKRNGGGGDPGSLGGDPGSPKEYQGEENQEEVTPSLNFSSLRSEAATPEAKEAEKPKTLSDLLKLASSGRQGSVREIKLEPVVSEAEVQPVSVAASVQTSPPVSPPPSPPPADPKPKKARKPKAQPDPQHTEMWKAIAVTMYGTTKVSNASLVGKAAGELLAAGVTLDEAKAVIEWLKGQYKFRPGGGNPLMPYHVLSHVDAWRASKSGKSLPETPMKPRRNAGTLDGMLDPELKRSW